MSDDEQVDPLIAMRAGLDQAIAMSGELARTYKGYFDAFVGEGFSEKQALYLTASQLLQNPGTPPA